MTVVAALYVEEGGAYYGLPDVEPWPESRDARLYAGPWPVVAHPPCGRWCAMARLNERRWGSRVGDDGGCFASALAAVRRWGGVLEHPAGSLAWQAFGLRRPTRSGWTRELGGSEWVTEVSQSAYGHKAHKRTWLLYVGPQPMPMDRRRPRPTHQVGGGVHTGNRLLPRLESNEAKATPVAFRDALLSLARSARKIGTQDVNAY